MADRVTWSAASRAASAALVARTHAAPPAIAAPAIGPQYPVGAGAGTWYGMGLGDGDVIGLARTPPRADETSRAVCGVV
eukprot:4064537-Prymnesium_polylepis.3